MRTTKTSGGSNLIYSGIKNVPNEFRAHQYDEICSLLELDDDFKKWHKDIRKKYDIPKLDPVKDFQNIPIYLNDKTYLEETSKWLESEGNKAQFEDEINKYINSKSIPIRLYDYIQYYVLYGKPKHVPRMNIGLISDVIDNLDQIEKIELTTSEKQSILSIFKFLISSNNNVSKKQFKNVYKYLRLRLSQSKKNQGRRFRTLDTAKKTLRLGKKETYFDYPTGKYLTHRTISTDLATDIFGDETGNKAALVRKQKQRLEERFETLLKTKMKN